MTNKDQFDDAEFDLFLQGKGDVASKLKAIGELVDSQGPSVELDAAILASIERAMAQEAAAASDTTFAAANDPVGPEFARIQPVRSQSSRWMMRWRVPLGLAAGMVLGVLLHRSFRSEYPLDSVAPLSAVSKSAPTVVPQMSAALQRPAEPPAIASADTAKPKPSDEALAEKRKDKASIPATLPAMAPIAAPAPTVAMNEVQRVEVTGSNIRRVDAESASPAQIITMEDLAKTPATLSQTPSNSSADKRSTEPGYVVAPPVIAFPSPVVAPIPVAAPPSPVVAPTMPVPLARSPVATAVAAPTPKQIQKSPHEWLVLIEDNLEVGRNDDAVQNWAIFRNAYPDYAVRPELMEKIAALQNHQGQK